MWAASRLSWVAVLVAASAPTRPVALAVLFVSQLLSFAGVPALGSAAVGAAGGLASQGELRLWMVLLIGICGAQAGGLAGWWIGGHAGRRASARTGRPAAVWRKGVASGERLRRRWGRLTVFLAPSWVAGALGFPLRQFAFWNLIGSAVWTIVAGLAAYGVGSAISPS
jgi:membrane protein DedA with SNARE-associated domain